ncbi:MAG: hemolysin XhlA family protein [Xenococcaceae cyanobacterium MO_188.B32]|nr:hemolysin XhlA family protein [Xenococcaceae cyanobacterium MO_188.B32]
MSNIQIESDLKEILNKLDRKLDNIENKFEQKLDNIQKDVTDINLRLTKVETLLDARSEDIKEIKGSQKAQIWTLIGVLVTAVGGFVVAVGRSVFSFN